jgi:hypothetical protein
MGHRCGYVEVPSGHPLYGLSYSQPTRHLRLDRDMTLGKRSPFLLLTGGVGALDGDDLRRSPDVVFDVHGGVTYSGGRDGYPAEGDGWWFGFDCAHMNDGVPGLWDHGPVRTTEYVTIECESLAEQIVRLTIPLAPWHVRMLEWLRKFFSTPITKEEG